MHIMLTVLNGRYKGNKYLVKKGQTLRIGRGSRADIIIEDPQISRLHCEVSNQGYQVVITDLDSSNGTYINNKRIKAAKVYSGDRLKAGSTVLEIRGVERHSEEEGDEDEPMVVVEKHGVVFANAGETPAGELGTAKSPTLPPGTKQGEGDLFSELPDAQDQANQDQKIMDAPTTQVRFEDSVLAESEEEALSTPTLESPFASENEVDKSAPQVDEPTPSVHAQHEADVPGVPPGAVESPGESISFDEMLEAVQASQQETGDLPQGADAHIPDPGVKTKPAPSPHGWAPAPEAILEPVPGFAETGEHAVPDSFKIEDPPSDSDLAAKNRSLHGEQEKHQAQGGRQAKLNGQALNFTESIPLDVTPLEGSLLDEMLAEEESVGKNGPEALRAPTHKKKGNV